MDLRPCSTKLICLQCDTNQVKKLVRSHGWSFATWSPASSLLNLTFATKVLDRHVHQTWFKQLGSMVSLALCTIPSPYVQNLWTKRAYHHLCVKFWIGALLLSSLTMAFFWFPGTLQFDCFHSADTNQLLQHRQWWKYLPYQESHWNWESRHHSGQDISNPPLEKIDYWNIICAQIFSTCCSP